MNYKAVHLLLADDDYDDCFLFEEALSELPTLVRLTTVHDGQELMELLGRKNERLPDLLFLDINMPLKNGLECFEEIRQSERLKTLPIILFSTSFRKDVAHLLHQYGVRHYVQKPSDFTQLTVVVQLALTMLSENNFNDPPQ